MTPFCEEENDIVFIYYLLERDYFEILFIISICGYTHTHTHTESIVLDLFFGGWELHLWHMEAPRLGFESELQLLAYTTATATKVLSHVCELHHSS